jgi:hypothetical protein
LQQQEPGAGASDQAQWSQGHVHATVPPVAEQPAVAPPAAPHQQPYQQAHQQVAAAAAQGARAAAGGLVHPGVDEGGDGEDEEEYDG